MNQSDRARGVIHVTVVALLCRGRRPSGSRQPFPLRLLSQQFLCERPKTGRHPLSRRRSPCTMRCDRGRGGTHARIVALLSCIRCGQLSGVIQQSCAASFFSREQPEPCRHPCRARCSHSNSHTTITVSTPCAGASCVCSICCAHSNLEGPRCPRPQPS